VRVLVVDDDAAGRDLLRSSLGERGWDVVTATDGEAALQVARATPPDVVVSDILMPGMDGYRLCREWRNDPVLRDIPFVFYTATYTSREDEEFALRLGADAFIVKPTRPEEFARIVEPIVRVQASETVRRGTSSTTEKGDETTVLGDYNERLVRKLEDKVLQLQQANAHLLEAIEGSGVEDTTQRALLEDVRRQLGDTPSAVDEADGRERLEDLIEQRTQELLAANERLEEAARAKSAFVAGMGHEMRDKLNTIIGFSGIMLQGLDGTFTEEQTEHAEMIYGAGQSLLALVNDVVDLSKLEAGQSELHIGQFEALGFIESVVESYRATAEERGIELGFTSPPGVIPMTSDRNKIEQILRNLLSNAVKFTEDGGVTVAAERADEGDTLVVRVNDTGGGIPAEVMARVFDEFVKYDRRGDVANRGTGLGLALTRRLCEMLGGSVSARSHPGEGSVFTVILPVDIAERASDRTASRDRRAEG
jgi:signal transduction histidine kinase